MGRKKKVRKIASLLELPPDLLVFRDELREANRRPKRMRPRYQKVRTAVVRTDVSSRPLTMGTLVASVLDGSQGPSVDGIVRAENTSVEASVPLDTGDAQPPPELSDECDCNEVILEDFNADFFDDLGIFF